MSNSAHAGVVTFTDMDAFLAAAGDVRTLDFATLPDGSPTTVDATLLTPEFNYTDQGVTFTSLRTRLFGTDSTIFVAGGPERPFLRAGFGSGCCDAIIADLLPEASAVGIIFSGGNTLSVFDSFGGLLAEVSGGAGGIGTFLGVISDIPIAHVIGDNGSGSESFDAFLFSPVPEPGTLALLGLGAIAVVRRRRRTGTVAVMALLACGLSPRILSAQSPIATEFSDSAASSRIAAQGVPTPGEDLATLMRQESKVATAVWASVAFLSTRLEAQIPFLIDPAALPIGFAAVVSADVSTLRLPGITPPVEATVVADAFAIAAEIDAFDAVQYSADDVVASDDDGEPSLGVTFNGPVALWLDPDDDATAFFADAHPSYTYVHWRGGVGGEIDKFNILDPTPPEFPYLILESSYSARMLFTFLADKHTLAYPFTPESLKVELVSEDAEGTEIDRSHLDCYMYRNLGDNFGPNRLVYYSNWQTPIVFVNHFVDDELHPTLSVLQVDAAGSVYPVLVKR